LRRGFRRGWGLIGRFCRRPRRFRGRAQLITAFHVGVGRHVFATFAAFGGERPRAAGTASNTAALTVAAQPPQVMRSIFNSIIVISFVDRR
jgi:hypothetical protein